MPFQGESMGTKRIARIAVLTAVALTIFMIELQIPPLVPVPGVKLGLANIITVYAIFLLGSVDAAMILLLRIILGSIFSGNLMAMLYSLAGGLMCYLVMLLLRHIVTEEQIWVCSVFGSIAHNFGQIAMAILVTRTPALISYLPVLMISGIAAGLFTGYTAQLLIYKLKKITKVE